MITEEPKIKANQRFELREAAEVLDVSPSTIIRWTKVGILSAAIRRTNGRRIWSGAELIKCWHNTF